MNLSKEMLAHLEALKTTDEYGTQFTNFKQAPHPDLVQHFAENYQIRTDVNQMCTRCQIQQIVKYEDSKIKGFSSDQFHPKCAFVPQGLRGDVWEKIKRIAAEKNIEMEQAKKLMLATIDPVAWAEVMFGFSDADPDWHLRAQQKEQLRCSARRIVARWGRRAGKALALNTPIPSPDGWTTMGDLTEGMRVFDERGRPCNITFATEVMQNHTCYDVHFNDGSIITADADHQWTVDNKYNRKNRARRRHLRYPMITLTTQQMVDAGVKIGKKQESNFSVPVTSPLVYTEVDVNLTIHPYILGFWLGDGCRGTSRVSIGLQDIAESSKNIQDCGYKMRIGKAAPLDHNIYGLITSLKQLGVEQRKHIPRSYLEASIPQRLELLKGLMDTDGSIDPSGRAEYTSSDPELAENVYELITGLGFKASLDIGESWLNGKRYKDRNRIYFNPYMNVFKLTRKVERIHPEKSIMQQTRYITAITPVDSVPVKCITVDSPNSLFLAGKAAIPTHNSFCMAIKLLHHVFNEKYVRGRDANGVEVIKGPEIMIITPFQSQVTNLFEEMESLLLRNTDLTQHIVSGSKSLYTKTPHFYMKFDNGAEIHGFVTGIGTKLDGGGGGTIRGGNANIIYMDEMDLIPDEIYVKVIQPLLLSSSDMRFYATSTPIGKRSFFWGWCTQRPDFKEIYVPSTVLSNWSNIKHEVESESTKDSFAAEYLAQFNDSTYGVFKPTLVHAARQDYTYEQTEEFKFWSNMGVSDRSELIYCIGIDWNKNAGSEFLVVAYYPPKSRFWVVDAVNVGPSEYSADTWKDKVRELNYKWKPHYIYADEGYGHTVIEDLRLDAHRLQGRQHTNKMDQQTVKLLDRLKSFNFSSNVYLRDPVDGREIVKPGKSFLVETAVRVFESEMIMFPETDQTLIKQLLNYVVLRTSENSGKPVYGPDNAKIADHRLDALMLALGGIYLERGVYAYGATANSAPEFFHRDRLQDSTPNYDPNMKSQEILQAVKDHKIPAYFNVLQLMRGEGRQDNQKIMEGYAAQEKVKMGRPKQGHRRGDLQKAIDSPPPPASAFSRDEEDLWRAQNTESFGILPRKRSSTRGRDIRGR